MRLYKYRSCNDKAWDILENSRLFSSVPSGLNDPLDSSIDIDEEYNRALTLMAQADRHPEKRDTFLMEMLNCHQVSFTRSGEETTLNRSIQEWIKAFGILSMSMTATDPLLWSHYADGHKGLCFGFDKELLDIDPASLSGVMNYVDVPVYIDVFNRLTQQFKEIYRPWEGVNCDSQVMDKFFSLQLAELTSANLLYKSTKWRYEQEYRIIDSRSGCRQFRSEALVEVICGNRMSRLHRTFLQSLLSDPKYRHVVIKSVRHKSGTFEFEIV